MSTTLNSEQRMLQDSVNRFGREYYDFEEWRKVVASGKAFEDKNWSRMAELGWLGIALPESVGGMDGSLRDAMVLMEEFGRSLMLEPYISTSLLGGSLLLEGNPDLAADLLPAMVDGRLRIAIALAEPGARFDLARVAATARSEGEDFILSGYKTNVADCSTAHWLIVPARTTSTFSDRYGVSLFLVPVNADGISVDHYRGPDYRHFSDVALDNVRVSGAYQLGPLHQGLDLLERCVDRAILASLAETLGVMDGARDLTLEYLKTREQFGRKIGEFQVLQHRMVDIAIACEEARSITYAALNQIDGPPEARRRGVSAAKVRVAQTSRFVGQQAVQLHGGIGTSDELIVSHYLRRLAMLEVRFGNADHHLQLFADLPLALAA
ncbi:acyl-CoA dehydrogenase [Cupriavidus taiwanensis]|uniref:acyl-CoA dehydrogenase family protein n=1 Tax=Cupriavidus taiwanensis TaxID=164546 RepID=UPI000E145163|nr:acyl-CoA dehydrogenase [Cupriavidus taiwanensis]SOZ29634.1 Acyl-CoA dehydrogenase family protein [Cupriavidus taiwanensis]SPA34459.1 Acyl-CoA dehydrogenase family protein [Cupriavidus taiwanensis]